MKISNLFLAAVASVVIAAPTIASAQGVTIKAGAGMHRDRGAFRGAHAEMGGHHHHHKMLVIKTGHHHHRG